MLLNQMPPARGNTGLTVGGPPSETANNEFDLRAAAGQSLAPAMVPFGQLNGIAGRKLGDTVGDDTDYGLR